MFNMFFLQFIRYDEYNYMYLLKDYDCERFATVDKIYKLN